MSKPALNGNTYEKALQYLDDGEFEKAEKIFLALLPGATNPSIRNNIASARLNQHNYRGVLEILGPNLEPQIISPFARAMASQALFQMGRKDEAEKMLNEAIRQFDLGIANPDKLDKNVSITGWYEYTVMIKRAAGLMMKHHMIVDLHRRWEKYYRRAEDYFQIGTAFFNLRRYKQAIIAWEKCVSEYHFLEDYLDTTHLVETTLIPEFELEYEIPQYLKIRPINEENIAKLVSFGSTKMYLLAFLFGTDDEAKQHIAGTTRILIKNSGAWGRKLADNILKANSLDMTYKHAAGEALVGMGVYGRDEAIPIRINGKDQMIKTVQLRVVEESPEYEKIVQEAVKLAKSGKNQDAIKMLQDIYMEQNVAYPPAIEVLAKLYFLTEEYCQAELMTKMLLNYYPESPYLLGLLAQIYLKTGETDKAINVLSQIDLKNVPPKMVGELQQLKQMAGLLQVPELMADEYEQYLVEEEWKKPLPKKFTMVNCLKRLPVQWLDAVCHVYDLPFPKKRQEREALAAEFLLTDKRLPGIINALQLEVQDLLEFILNQGEPVKLGVITKKFGPMDDGFYWIEEPPESPLGQLCAHGLVSIGTMEIDGRRYKVVAIPEDLRGRIKELID